jgi:hypothetical protein
MVDVARALMGLGAAFKNEVPQFQQRMQQEDLYKMKMADMDMARQDALAKREEERKKTLFQDVAVAKQYFDRGDFGSIADIARDRLDILTPMGVNTRDSQQMLQLADAARAGDPTAIKGLKDQLDTIYSVGSLYNVYGSGSTPASFRALELQAQAAGIPKGSPEYEEFMRYGGATREEGAKGLTRFVNGSYIQVTGTGNRVYDTSGTEVTDPAKRQEVIKQGYDSGILREGAIATATETARGNVQRGQEVIDSGRSAAQAIPAIKSSLVLLNRIATGGVAGLGLRIRRALGGESADEGELAYNLRKQVLQQLKPTFGAAFTAREGDLLREIEASESRKTEANVRLLSNLLEALQLDAEIGRTRALGMEDTPTVREIDSYLNAQLGANASGIFNAIYQEQNPSSASGGSLPMITTQAAFDALPSGAQYIEDDSGTIYRKP